MLLRYGLLALPLAFAGLPLYLHAPDFYVTKHGLSLATVGAALLGLRIIDAIQDPLIGALSDRFGTRRMRIIQYAALILAVSFFALFHPPASYALLWFIVFVFLATTAYSILSINLNSLGALWGASPFIQTRITSTRESLGIIGLLCAVTIPSLPIDQPFTVLSIMLTILLILALILLRSWRKQAESPNTRAVTSALLSGFLSFTPTTKWFFLAFALSMLASSIPAVLVIFFVRDLLGAEGYLGAFLLLYFLAGIAGIPIWQAISKRCGKCRTWLWSMLLAVISFIGAYFLEVGALIPYAIICITSGIAFSADLILPPSIIADQIHAQPEHDTSSAHYGMLAFLTKAALALSSGFSLLVLDLAGFVPATQNSPTALNALSLLYALIPCLIKLIAATVLWTLSTRITEGVTYATHTSPRFAGSHPHA
ncbi:MAG: MFS transporter [Alphaproteobacteria bacterium]|nr:MFS transporter [Alphaproteobacteria bacterium]